MTTNRKAIDPTSMLTGLRVLDLSHFFPGPFIGMMLQRYGANVTKVENPDGGDLIKYVAPLVDNLSIYYRALNFGKEQQSIDLKTEAGRRAVYALVKQSDIVIESFRPGVAARLGIDYDSLREVNPQLIYCALSAFGQFSELSSRPCHDLGVQAEASSLFLSNQGSEKPIVPRLPMADLSAALMGLNGILMALHRREANGGAYIDVSMYTAMLAAMPNIAGHHSDYLTLSESGVERHGGEAAFYRYYATRDGRQLVLAGQEPKFVKALLDHIGCAHLTTGYLEGERHANQDVAHALERYFMSMHSDEACSQLDDLGVCYGIVRTADEVVERELDNGTGTLIKDDAGVPILGHPIKFYV